jgi:hypothetical protein
MSIASLAMRTWLRYLGPFAVLAVLAATPVLGITYKLMPELDAAHARARLVLGAALVVAAWIVQLALVAAVSPAVRGIACGAPIAQRRAIVDGAGALVRAIVPTAVVIAAILLGGLALVVPGLVLLVLLSLTGASERLAEPLPAALTDSVEIVRGMFWRVALVVALAIVVDLAIADGGQLSLLGAVSKKPTPVQLAAARLSKVVPLALAAVSPLVACALAACHARRKRA